VLGPWSQLLQVHTLVGRSGNAFNFFPGLKPGQTILSGDLHQQLVGRLIRDTGGSLLSSGILVAVFWLRSLLK